MRVATQRIGGRVCSISPSCNLRARLVVAPRSPRRAQSSLEEGAHRAKGLARSPRHLLRNNERSSLASWPKKASRAFTLARRESASKQGRPKLDAARATRGGRAPIACARQHCARTWMPAPRPHVAHLNPFLKSAGFSLGAQTRPLRRNCGASPVASRMRALFCLEPAPGSKSRRGGAMLHATSLVVPLFPNRCPAVARPPAPRLRLPSHSNLARTQRKHNDNNNDNSGSNKRKKNRDGDKG